MLLERVGDEEQFVLEPEGAGVGDPLDWEVAGVLERRQAFRKGPERGGVTRAGSLPAERGMWSLLIVEGAEGSRSCG